MSAVAAAVAVARAQGRRVGEPVVLRDAWHVLVHLRPLPIVARVSSARPFPAGPKPEDVVRELDVAGHAARAGAPVVPPAAELNPGPHRHGGHIVTFWRYVEPQAPADAREAGRALRAVHEALADYDGSLPPPGHPQETNEMLAWLGPSEAADVVRTTILRRPHVDGHALNGDAHLDNCLGSPDGPLWHDFETACRGPREYDLAALIARDRVFGGDERAREALAAYGDHDPRLLDEMLPLYVAWVTASMLTALPRRPELRAGVATRINWLSRQ